MYNRRNHHKIYILKDDKKKLGACGNFSELLKYSDSDYIMFCDQDDVWLNDKIKITLKKMKQAESLYGRQTPIMVHTDLMVVSENLEPIADSFWKFAHLDPSGRKSISRLLIQNFVTGCTMMINRALKNLTPSIPGEALSHDWWMALVACSFGKIESIPIPTIMYRQHQKNEFGARNWNHFKFLLNAIKAIIRQNLIADVKEEKNQMEKLYNQARSFYNYYSEQLDGKQSLALINFINLATYNFFKRRRKLIEYGFIRSGFARNLKLFLIV